MSHANSKESPFLKNRLIKQKIQKTYDKTKWMHMINFSIPLCIFAKTRQVGFLQKKKILYIYYIYKTNLRT